MSAPLQYGIIGIVGLVVVGAVLSAGPGTGPQAPVPDSTASGEDRTNDSAGTDWRQVELEAVRDGERFTIDGLEPPVLVESFAVWCSTCTRQQRELIEYRQRDDAATVVSLNTDPNEDAATVADHADGNGFDWRYAIAPPEMTRSMIDRYGEVIIQAPAVPTVLVCANGTRLLPTGVKPPEKIASAVSAGC